MRCTTDSPPMSGWTLRKPDLLDVLAGMARLAEDAVSEERAPLVDGLVARLVQE